MARPATFGENGRVRRALAVLCVVALLVGDAAPVAADRWYSETPVLGIVDAGRQAAAAREAGATWDRALFLWQLIQPNGPSDWALDTYIDQANLKTTLSAGQLERATAQNRKLLDHSVEKGRLTREAADAAYERIRTSAALAAAAGRRPSASNANEKRRRLGGSRPHRFTVSERETGDRIDLDPERLACAA